MSVEKYMISDNLLRLKPSDALEKVSMSKLARTGTSVLQHVMTSSQAMAVTIQGHSAMVTLSHHQYDELVALIRHVHDEQAEDGFTAALSHRFDELIADMNKADAARKIDSALFADPAALNKTYQPGLTETND